MLGELRWRELRIGVERVMLTVGGRFHAWQASLLFTAMFVIHLLFSWSRFFSWVIFLGDLGLMGWLTMRAYRDADTLDRYVIFWHRKQNVNGRADQIQIRGTYCWSYSEQDIGR